jgi:hypothetical protein
LLDQPIINSIMVEIKSVESSSNFSQSIERIVKEKRVTYMEAVLLYAEENQMEVETAAKLVKMNSTIKGKVQLEAEDLNCLKEKSARLPI